MLNHRTHSLLEILTIGSYLNQFVIAVVTYLALDCCSSNQIVRDSGYYTKYLLAHTAGY